MAEGSVKKVRYDDDRLRAIVAEKGLTLASVGVSMGHDKSFLTHKKSREGITDGTFMTLTDLKLLSLILGVPESDLIYKEPEPEPEPHQLDTMLSFRNLSSLIQQEMNEMKSLCQEAAKMSESNHRDLCMIKKSLEKMDGDNEAAWNKLNAINLAGQRLKDQVAKLNLDVNDSLAEMAEKLSAINPDDSEQLKKAKLLVTEMLKPGQAEQNDVYNRAAVKGINKKYIDRAKTELDIVVTAQGYGKNQSKIWSYK